MQRLLADRDRDRDPVLRVPGEYLLDRVPVGGRSGQANIAFWIAIDAASAIAVAPTSRPRTNPLRASGVAVFCGDLISYSFVSVGWRVVEQVRGVRWDGHRFFLREERSVRREWRQVWACTDLADPGGLDVVGGGHGPQV